MRKVRKMYLLRIPVRAHFSLMPKLDFKLVYLGGLTLISRSADSQVYYAAKIMKIVVFLLITYDAARSFVRFYTFTW